MQRPPRHHELRLDPSVAQWTVQALTRLLATFALVQGASIIVGGPGRWRGPAFALALTAPGAPASWGVALLLCGGVALGCTFANAHTGTFWSMLALGTWALFFAVSFAVTAMRNPHAATTGVWAYFTFSIASCTLGSAYRQSRGGI